MTNYKESVKKGCLAALISVGFFIACCGGMLSCCNYYDQQSYQRARDKAKPFVDENNAQVKILWVYPQTNQKGHFIGHLAVVEGVKNKIRKEIRVQPLLPIVDEIWIVDIDDRGAYFFKAKLF